MIELKSVDLRRKKVEALFIPVCEDGDLHLNKTVLSLIEKAKTSGSFKGEKKQMITLYHLPEVKIDRVTFIGLGNLENMDVETMRVFSGKAVKTANGDKIKNIAIAPPISSKSSLGSEETLTALSEGALLGNHVFNKYKKDENGSTVGKIELFVTPQEAKKYSGLAARVETLCGGTILAREWVSTPSNDKVPQVLASDMAAKARKAGLKVKVLTEKELKQKKFGAMLSVSAGSQNAPRLVVMEYSPKKAEKTIALVGKGVTFDSGGISLKPSSGMEAMKSDMAGAAAVAATLLTIAKLKPKVKVIGAMPLVENMPSGSATRPGDIVKSYEGKTVEIGNTDAEGRLILIDAMAFVNKSYKPDVMIDMATLTGACLVALGEKLAGVFTPDDDLANRLVDAGKTTHERCWQLPMPEDYRELLKSKFADISNMSSSRWGGAVAAALFLSEFVGDTPWAHIDIAGPAFQTSASDYCGPGGTGFGVRLMCKLIEGYAK